MKRATSKLLPLLLSLAMIMEFYIPSTSAVEANYAGISGHWAHKSIERWNSNGIIQGSKGYFFPTMR